MYGWKTNKKYLNIYLSKLFNCGIIIFKNQLKVRKAQNKIFVTTLN